MDLIFNPVVLGCADLCIAEVGENLYNVNVLGKTMAYKHAFKCFSVSSHELYHSAQHPFYSDSYQQCYAELVRESTGRRFFVPNINFVQLLMVIGIGKLQINYTPAERDVEQVPIGQIENYFRRKIYRMRYENFEDLINKIHIATQKTKNKFSLAVNANDYERL